MILDFRNLFYIDGFGITKTMITTENPKLAYPHQKGFIFRVIMIFAFFLLMVSCTENTSDSENRNENEFEYAYNSGPGISANDFLSSENFSELVIEIDYMGDYAPDEGALAALREFLTNRLYKTSITILEPSQISASSQSNYSASQIRNLEQQFRDYYTEEDKLAVYMLIVDGRYQQNNVLGIAYQNTSTVYFGSAFDDATSGFSSPSLTETQSITFRHEFGHLLGLVGIPNSGTDMQTNHKDEEHGNHCNNDNCLMYWAMESPELFDRLLGSEIPQLDENCIKDLQANGGK